MSNVKEGIIRDLFGGYGFIDCVADRRDYFFYFGSVIPKTDADSLRICDAVQFEIRKDNKNRWEAFRVMKKPTAMEGHAVASTRNIRDLNKLTNKEAVNLEQPNTSENTRNEKVKREMQKLRGIRQSGHGIILDLPTDQNIYGTLSAKLDKEWRIVYYMYSAIDPEKEWIPLYAGAPVTITAHWFPDTDKWFASEITLPH